MAIKPKDVYKGRQKSHRAKKIVIAAVIALVLGVIVMFFALRSYATYDENGNAKIIWPWNSAEQSSAP